VSGDRRLISEAAFEQMHQPQTMIPTSPGMRAARHVDFFAGYGLGWTVMDYRGRLMLWHSGSAEGMPSYMALLPKEGLAVLVMTNSSGGSALRGAVAERIFDYYLGVPEQSPAPAPRPRTAEPAPPAAAPATDARPALALATYAGTYRNDLYGDINVSPGKTGLALQIARGEQADLRHLNGDNFQIAWRDPVFAEVYPSSVTFHVGPKGQSYGLIARIGDETAEAVRLP
jgi:hypothetical protein